MSLYEQFLNLSRGPPTASSYGGSAQHRARRAVSPPEVIELDDEPPPFQPCSHTMQRVEGRIPDRHTRRFSADAFSIREKIVRTAFDSPSTLLPPKFRSIVKKNYDDPRVVAENRVKMAGQSLSGTPGLDLQFKQDRRTKFLKEANVGDIVIAKIIKSTLNFKVGSLQVKLLGWYCKGDGVVLWDHSFAGSVSIKQADARVVGKARIDDILRCKIIDADRLQSLQFVELTTICRRSPLTLGLLEDDDVLAGVRRMFLLDYESSEIPQYSEALEKSPQLETTDTLEKIRVGMSLPAFASSFAPKLAKTFDVAVLREKQGVITAGFFYQRGFDAMAQRDLGKAQQCFDKALEYDPRNADAYVGRAVIHQEKGNYPQALEDMMKALDCNPNHKQAPKLLATILVSLGKAFLEGGNTTEALVLFEKSLKYDPENPEALASVMRLRGKSRDQSPGRSESRTADVLDGNRDSRRAAGSSKYRAIDEERPKYDKRRRNRSISRSRSRSRSRERRRHSRTRSKSPRSSQRRGAEVDESPNVDIDILRQLPPPNVPPPAVFHPFRPTPVTVQYPVSRERDRAEWEAKTAEFLAGGRVSSKHGRRPRSRSPRVTNVPNYVRSPVKRDRDSQGQRRRHRSRSRSSDERRKRRRSRSRSRGRDRSRDRERAGKVRDAPAKGEDELVVVAQVSRPTKPPKEPERTGPPRTMDTEEDSMLKLMWTHWRLACRDRRRRFGLAFVNWFQECVKARRNVDGKASAVFDFPYANVEPAFIFADLYPDDRTMDWLFDAEELHKKSSRRKFPVNALQLLAKKYSSQILKMNSKEGATKTSGPTPAILDPARENFPDELKKHIEMQKQSASAKPAGTQEAAKKPAAAAPEVSFSKSTIASKFGILKRKPAKEKESSVPVSSEDAGTTAPPAVAAACEPITSPSGVSPMEIEELSSGGVTPEPEMIPLPKPVTRRVDLLPDGVVPGEEDKLEPVFAELKPVQEVHGDDVAPLRPPLAEPLMRAIASLKKYEEEKKMRLTVDNMVSFKATRSPWADEKWFGGPTARSAMDAIREAEEELRKLAEAAEAEERKKREAEEARLAKIRTAEEAVRKAKEAKEEALRKAKEAKEEALRKAKEAKEEALRKAKEAKEEALRKAEEAERKAREAKEEAERKLDEERRRKLEELARSAQPDFLENLFKTLEESAAKIHVFAKDKKSDTPQKPPKKEGKNSTEVVAQEKIHVSAEDKLDEAQELPKKEDENSTEAVAQEKQPSDEKEETVETEKTSVGEVASEPKVDDADKVEVAKPVPETAEADGDWQVQDEVVEDRAPPTEGHKSSDSGQAEETDLEEPHDDVDQLVTVDVAPAEEEEEEQQPELLAPEVEGCPAEDVDQLVTIDVAPADEDEPEQLRNSEVEGGPPEEDIDQLVTVDVAAASPEAVPTDVGKESVAGDVQEDAESPKPAEEAAEDAASSNAEYA